MSYSKLIHDYLDGGLSGPQEELLFMELGKNPELRQDFNQNVRLHIIAQSDMKSIAPPSESANYIFSSLGFSMPSAEFLESASSGPAVAPRSAGSNLWGRIRRFAPLLGLLLFLAVPTYFAVDYLGGSADDLASKSASSITGKGDIPTVESYLAGSDLSEQAVVDESANNSSAKADGPYINIISADNAANISGHLSHTPNSGHSQPAAAKPDGRANNAAARNIAGIAPSSEYYPANASSGIMAGGAGLAGGFTANLPSALGIYDPMIFNQADFDPTAGYADHKYSISIDYSMAYSSPDFTLPTATEKLINNAQVSGFYKLSQNHWIGAEIGFDEFNQSYDYMNEGMIELRKQMPQLFYYGIAYRMSMPELFLPYSVYPFGELFGGGTVSGPYFKASAGIKWRVARNIDFAISYKYGRLFYNVQDKIYFSDKYGMNYSLSYNF